MNSNLLNMNNPISIHDIKQISHIVTLNIPSVSLLQHYMHKRHEKLINIVHKEMPHLTIDKEVLKTIIGFEFTIYEARERFLKEVHNAIT